MTDFWSIRTRDDTVVIITFPSLDSKCKVSQGCEQVGGSIDTLADSLAFRGTKLKVGDGGGSVPSFLFRPFPFGATSKPL